MLNVKWNISSIFRYGSYSTDIIGKDYDIKIGSVIYRYFRDKPNSPKGGKGQDKYVKILVNNP